MICYQKALPWWPLASRHSWPNEEEAIPLRTVLYNRLSAAMLPINWCLSARNTSMEDDKQRESWLDSGLTSIRETRNHWHHGRFSGGHSPMSGLFPSMESWNDPEAKPNSEARSAFKRLGKHVKLIQNSLLRPTEELQRLKLEFSENWRGRLFVKLLAVWPMSTKWTSKGPMMKPLVVMEEFTATQGC